MIQTTILSKVINKVLRNYKKIIAILICGWVFISGVNINLHTDKTDFQFEINGLVDGIVTLHNTLEGTK